MVSDDGLWTRDNEMYEMLREAGATEEKAARIADGQGAVPT